MSTTKAGQFSFQYTLTNEVGSDVASVTITMGVSSPAAMIALANQDQTTTVGTAVAEAPSVRVVDVYNNPVPGVSVTFVPGLGSLLGATVTGNPATSDANGVATVGSWTLGTKVGVYRVNAVASAPGGNLLVPFVGHAAAGAPAGLLLTPLTSGPPPVSLTLNGGATLRFKALVADSYGNPLPSIDQVVNFSSSNEAVAVLSPSSATTPFALTDVTGRYLTTNQNVEIRASLAESPSIKGGATLTVAATDPPPAPKNDTFVIEHCTASLLCTLTSSLTGNVFSDNGSGADDLGNPPAVITRFGTGSRAGFIGGSLGSIDGWFPVGTTAISPFGGTQVTLAADGTLTFSRVLPIDSPSTTFVFTFQYEVQNVWGTTAATVRIERGVSGTSVTTSRTAPVRSSLTKTP